MKVIPQFRVLPLLIVVAMLAFSVRLVDFVSGVSSLTKVAMAEDRAGEDHKVQPEVSTEPLPDETELEHVGGEDSAAEDEEAAPGWRDAGEEEFEYSTITREVFDDLGKRRRALDQREKEIVAREALLRAAEQEIERKFQELSNLRIEIEALLQKQSEEERARIQSLVKIYEGMKPKEAARIFDTLDLDVLVEVMSKMSERRLSPILAKMNPERARTITIMLAEEKQLPRLPGGD